MREYQNEVPGSTSVQKPRLDTKALELPGVVISCYFIGHPTTRHVYINGNHPSTPHLKRDSLWGASVELWQQKQGLRAIYTLAPRPTDVSFYQSLTSLDSINQLSYLDSGF